MDNKKNNKDDSKDDNKEEFTLRYINITIFNNSIDKIKKYIDMGFTKGAYTMNDSKEILDTINILNQVISQVDTNQQYLMEAEKRAKLEKTT